MRGIIKHISLKLSFLCSKREYFDIFKITSLTLAHILFYEKKLYIGNLHLNCGTEFGITVG